MPVVASFDGENRRIFLDASVAGAEFDPLEIYREYLVFRRDNEAFRAFEPLVRMKGGEPKSATTAAPRFLQLQTDRRGITTKIILPDSGPYRVSVHGEIATDVPDTDPEPFDLSTLTTTGVVIDYRPVATEIVLLSAGGSGLSTDEQARLARIEKFLRNRQYTNPVTGKLEIMDDANAAVEFEADIFADDGVTAYDGSNGINRRNRLEETP